MHRHLQSLYRSYVENKYKTKKNHKILYTVIMHDQRITHLIAA